MKIAYNHLSNLLLDKPSIEDVSKKLFQLGHEHEIEDSVFDIEFTPNRGDCLSLVGLARDLNVFYSVTFNLPGVYLYHCTPHGNMGMLGLVIVGMIFTI